MLGVFFNYTFLSKNNNQDNMDHVIAHRFYASVLFIIGLFVTQFGGSREIDTPVLIGLGLMGVSVLVFFIGDYFYKEKKDDDSH